MITHPTHDTLSENVSTQVVESRCRRRSFLDKVAITALDYAELIAKRAAALAGSDGAIQFATERCLLIPYPLQIAGEKERVFPPAMRFRTAPTTSSGSTSCRRDWHEQPRGHRGGLWGTSSGF